MVHIQSETVENRRGKKKQKRKKEETTAAEYNGAALLGGHNKPKKILVADGNGWKDDAVGVDDFDIHGLGVAG